MKLSDYVVSFLEEQGATHAFLVAGGGMMHLMESISRGKKIKYICTHHEQAAAMAAEGFQRVSGGIGVALSTTGPGGTNMVTGTECAWMDSIPVIYISGQANSKKLIGDTGVRQRGVHEADIITIVKSITKYAVIVLDEAKIRYHLEKAAYLARNGRPGPVWLDIPIDIQAKDIDPEKLERFDAGKECPKNYSQEQLKAGVSKVVEMLSHSKRPVFIAGHGIRCAKAIAEFNNLAESLMVPVVLTKNGYDLVPHSSEIHIGMCGINGQRAANFAAMSCDLAIVLGSRLAYPFVGYDSENFAPGATKVVVDIDEKQLEWSTVSNIVPMNYDVGDFIREFQNQANRPVCDTSKWIEKCKGWKTRYPTVLPSYREETKFVNPYYFVEFLGDTMPDEAVVVTDQGATFFCPTQAMKMRKGQRCFTNCGFSPMGYGLPAAIGACFALNKADVICLHGDGGIQLNIHELQTIIHHKLPIKLFVFNNQGYLSIKHTQTAYFGGHFVGADPSSGLSCPDMIKVAQAYGFKTDRISNSRELRDKLDSILKTEGPILVEVMLDPLQQFIPKVQSEKKADGTMVSKPLDDMYPYLDRETYAKEKDFGQ